MRRVLLASMSSLSLASCLPGLPPLPQVDGDSTSSGVADPPEDVSATFEPDPQGDGTDGGATSFENSTTSDTSGTGDGDGPVDTTLPPSEPIDAGSDLDGCSVWDQDCPDGSKCMPWANDGGSAWNDARCSPLDPSPALPGDPCEVEGSSVSGVDDCDIAAMCWNVDAETNEGTCVSFCAGSEVAPSCEDPAAACSISNEGVLALCLPVCDPLAQDCSVGQGCYPQGGGSGFVCSPDASDGGGVYPLECAYVNGCAPGHACLDDVALPACGSYCCAPYCDTSISDVCPSIDPALQCLPWYEADQAPPGYEHVGVCGTPS
jgi:hypothetical protein